MVIRMRHTRAHTRNRRAHHALEAKKTIVCPKCKADALPHRVCMNCGTYKGKEAINVLAKLDKKKKKQKKKELATKEK